jgi:hypothetical protein
MAEYKLLNSPVVYLFLICQHIPTFHTIIYCRDKWVPVTTAWHVLRLRMEERPPIWRVAANILNKESRTADKGWSSRVGVGRGDNNSLP